MLRCHPRWEVAAPLCQASRTSRRPLGGKVPICVACAAPAACLSPPLLKDTLAPRQPRLTGVAPPSSRGSAGAPAPMSTSAALAWPPSAAACSGVAAIMLPSSAAASCTARSPPAAASRRERSTSSPRAAASRTCRALGPTARGGEPRSMHHSERRAHRARAGARTRQARRCGLPTEGAWGHGLTGGALMDAETARRAAQGLYVCHPAQPCSLRCLTHPGQLVQ